MNIIEDLFIYFKSYYHFWFNFFWQFYVYENHRHRIRLELMNEKINKEREEQSIRMREEQKVRLNSNVYLVYHVI